MFRKILLIAALLGAITLCWQLPAQDKSVNSSALQQAMDVENYRKADSIVRKEVEFFLHAGNLDTVISYIPFVGKIANARYGSQKAASAVFEMIDTLKVKNASSVILVDAYRSAAEFFSSTGLNQDGYKASELSLVYTLAQEGFLQSEVAQCEYNMGVYAHKLGNVSLSLFHHRKAMAIREADPATDPEDIYLSANAMASQMWYASKYDSARLLFNKALQAVSKMPVNDVNKYFRPANIQNNLAALYNAEGNTSEAIKAMEYTIDNFQKFIAGKEVGGKRQSAIEGLYEAIDNLAGVYKEIGNYGKVGSLLMYSYQQKQQKLDSSHQGIFISEILLGQHYQALHENELALEYLTKGLNRLEGKEGDYLFWAADAHYALALVYESKKDIGKAQTHYLKSEQLYEESYQGEYDNIYMDFVRSASVFYAKNGNYARAVQLADNVYQYLEKVGESKSLQGFNQLLNIAEINFLARQYASAISFSNKALKVIEEKIKDGTTLLDSLQIDAFKPKAILIQVKSTYALQPKRDSVFLNGLAARLGDALEILEKRKVLIDDPESINILIANNQELIDFAKKIELDLVQLTGSAFHLDRFINLHETALYTRIRGRLDIQQAMQYSGFPDSMYKRELEIKNAMTAALEVKSQLISTYLDKMKEWDTHLAMIKKNYPDYYALRYETPFRSLTDIQSGLTDSTAVVRYYFVDTLLYALVVDKHHHQFIRLTDNGLEENINSLFVAGTSEKVLLPLLYELHKTLWAPVEDFVRARKVTIIPDGVLFNLNFDMLSSGLLNGYNEFSSKSLLAKYTFSYHYSLLMLGRPVQQTIAGENYIAFAPGFSDDVKRKYVSGTKDSVSLDYGYLQLLPQPATNKLTKKIKGELGGEVYLDETSTRNAFKEYAGGHKIIHIGTHASFNNINPEQSGLIFAKNAAAGDSNFLSLQEVYNCNMRSDLTILTACESGRPGYQDGEGMVSLAHAFNYAGSDRILMALWQIDEQSSAKITDMFIQFLENGISTDEALRQAKLQYLNESSGRTMAPAHWAGLVMMGEPVQLVFNSSSSFPYGWLIGIGVVVAILSGWLYVRKRKMF